MEIDFKKPISVVREFDQTLKSVVFEVLWDTRDVNTSTNNDCNNNDRPSVTDVLMGRAITSMFFYSIEVYKWF